MKSWFVSGTNPADGRADRSSPGSISRGGSGLRDRLCQGDGTANARVIAEHGRNDVFPDASFIQRWRSNITCNDIPESGTDLCKEGIFTQAAGLPHAATEDDPSRRKHAGKIHQRM